MANARLVQPASLLIATLFVATWYPRAFAQAAADAATAAEDPTTIDQTWQKASAKYETARATIIKSVDRINSEGPFRPDWESLQNYKVPEWYMDAKFGIFIHWGVYSVPAFGT